MSNGSNGPLVSVVVPVLNAAAFLDRCLRALVAQELREGFEVLVVDNGSTDGSRSIAKAHETQGPPRVRVLEESRPGAYAARNRGLKEARGDIIAFTDPDCQAPAGWLERLTAPFGAAEVEVVQGRTVPASRSRLLDLMSAYEHQRNVTVFESEDPSLYFGQCNNLAARRRTVESAGGFVERFRGGDALLVRRVVDSAGCTAVRYEPSARVIHGEVETLRDHLRKARIYRASRRGYSRSVTIRSPNLLERVRSLHRAVRSGELSRAAVPPTLLLLAGVQLFSRIPAPSSAESRPSAPCKVPSGTQESRG